MNGYFLAVGGARGDVQLWDLRKGTAVDKIAVGRGSVKNVTFDESGECWSLENTFLQNPKYNEQFAFYFS